MARKPTYEELEQRIAELERSELDRKRAEEALRESEERLSSIIQGSPIPTFMIGKDHRVIHWNRALEEMSGISAGAVIGTRQQWRAFYGAERPCMADLLIDEAFNMIPQYYKGNYDKSALIEEAYEATGFFPDIGESGRWLRFTAAAVRDSRSNLVGALETLEDITARKQAEEQLTQASKDTDSQSEKLRTVVNSAPFGMVLIGKDGTFTHMNPKFKELFGYDEADVPNGKEWFRKAFPDAEYRHGVIAAWIVDQESAKHGERRPRVFQVTCKDGSNKTASITAVLLENGENLVSFEDISERKRAAEALRESEERLRELYDGAPVGYHEYDTEGRITRVNRTDLEMLGYSSQEMIGEYVWKFNVEEEVARPQILEKLAGLRSPGHALERTYRRKDGSTFPVLIEDRLNKDEQGRITGIRCTIQDITESKRAEEALRESEERFRLLVENAPDAVFVRTEDRFAYVNQAALKLFGVSSANRLLGQSVLDRIHPDSRAIAAERMKRIDTVLEALPLIEQKYLKLDGTPVNVEASPVPFVYEGRNSALVFVRDITERKRAEEEKEKLQTQLQRAQKMEAIGTLAGGVAHDLNNILSGIVSYPDLLLMQLPEDSPLRKPLATIQESGKRAAAIVQDLLTLARRAVPTAEVVNLNDVITEYLQSPEHEKLRSFHPDVQLETHLDTGLLNVLGSPVHLSKTVMNLVSNAAEAMPHGGKVLISTENRYIDSSIRRYEHVEEGDYVTLSVSDTGVGISSEGRERIFEPFYTKKVMGRSGTGLGMAVVWGTVKDHKGYIDIQSSEGKGAIFTLYFPVTRKELIKDKFIFPIEEYKGEGESILVVDDVEGQREIASALLSHLGYSVTTVSSGEEAVGYMKNTAVDLVVLDMIMDPGIDGLETYKQILEMHPKQKAIIASGFSETRRVSEAQRLGAGQYVKKPYTLEKLCMAVRRELDR